MTLPALRHNQTNTAQVILVKLVLTVNATCDGVYAVVEEVVVQLTVTTAKFLLLEEERIVHQSEGVEDVKLVPLGQNERIVSQLVETLLQRSLVHRLLQANLGTIVEHVRHLDDAVFGIADGRRLDTEEGEKVGDFSIKILKKRQVSFLKVSEYPFPNQNRLTSTTYVHTTCSPLGSILGTNQW